MRVFITGARGFIGQSLARHYRAQGATVSGIDFQADPEWGVLAGDLSQPEAWKSALAGVDLVIHTAAVVSNTASFELAWQVNVKGTADLLDACIDAGVKRFIQLSSVAAFGFQYPEQVTEDFPLRPMGNSYVDTKIASEHAVLACHASGRMDCTIVRPGDVYGPGSKPWVVLPLEMMQQGKFVLPAGGEGLFSPVYIDDLVQGIVLAAASEVARGQIYTISGGAEVSCRVFFGHHQRMLGKGARLRTTSTGFARVAAQLVGSLTRFFGGESELGRGTIDMLSRVHGYSIEKARTQLGYQPEVNLDEGMQHTKHWLRGRKLIA